MKIINTFHNLIKRNKSEQPNEYNNQLNVQNNNFSRYFEQIEFEKLPNAFVIKCNHGCKWQYIIKNKNEFLKNKRLLNIVKGNMTGWLEQEYWCWQGFEMQYATSRGDKSYKRNRFQDVLSPKILIEPLMRENRLIEIYCFNGVAQIYAYINKEEGVKICTYETDFSYSDLVLKKEDKEFMVKIPADDNLKHAVKLSEKLSQDFKFVRVDWIVYKNKLYFEELTFTPYSGFSDFDKNFDKKLGKWMELSI